MSTPSKLNVTFLGSDSFGCPILRALLKDKRVEVSNIITGIDKEAGRGKKVLPTPLLLSVMEEIPASVKIHKTDKIQSLDSIITASKDSLFLVVAYGQIIPQHILDLAPDTWINIHPSLLPLYRGASPMQQALLNGDKETGVTWMKVSKKMDSGPIVSQINYPIPEESNYETLSEQLGKLAAAHTVEVLMKYQTSQQSRTQAESEATYCNKISKEDALVNFNTDKAATIDRKVKAFSQWPQVRFQFASGDVKILTSRLSGENLQPGQPLMKNGKHLIVGTYEGALELLTVQPASKKPMSGADFMRGYKVTSF